VNKTAPGLNTRVREARSEKSAIDLSRPVDTLFEVEPTGDGGSEPTLTLFLAGAECPYTCVFCDLWKYTSDGPTPAGAIPAQIRHGLHSLRREGVLKDSEGSRSLPAWVDPGLLRVKLYNASNFFEARAVPACDDEAILDLLAPYPAVTVENHPRLTNERCLSFAAGLNGRLEVAMGLETVARDTLARLNKRTTLDDFARAAETLHAHNVDVRAFVLLAPPFQSASESVEWALRSVEYAFENGARFVAINPVRSGNGFMDRLQASGDWTPPTLADVEAALGDALALGGGIVVVDLWEIENFAGCPDCDGARIANLRSMNEAQLARPVISCARCNA
jgi:archaeosine synthase beta-subunit